jgi:hypothetical protein
MLTLRRERVVGFVSFWESSVVDVGQRKPTPARTSSVALVSWQCAEDQAHSLGFHKMLVSTAEIQRAADYFYRTSGFRQVRVEVAQAVTASRPAARYAILLREGAVGSATSRRRAADGPQPGIAALQPAARRGRLFGGFALPQTFSRRSIYPESRRGARVGRYGERVPLAEHSPGRFAFTKLPSNTTNGADCWDSHREQQPPIPLRLDQGRCSRADSGDLHDDLFVLGTVEVHRIRRMLHVAPRL